MDWVGLNRSFGALGWVGSGWIEDIRPTDNSELAHRTVVFINSGCGDYGVIENDMHIWNGVEQVVILMQPG